MPSGLFGRENFGPSQGHPARPAMHLVLDAIRTLTRRVDPQAETGKCVIPDEEVIRTRSDGLNGSLVQARQRGPLAGSPTEPGGSVFERNQPWSSVRVAALTTRSSVHKRIYE